MQAAAAADAADMILPAPSGRSPAPSENEVSANTAAASSQRTAGRLNDQMFLRCLIPCLLSLGISSALCSFVPASDLREVRVKRLCISGSLGQLCELDHPEPHPVAAEHRGNSIDYGAIPCCLTSPF